ncbi:response regulator [filamentous cyanobacterium LEGE 11480]|uniref:Response regulator n=1 Tax=Romeriopsis navalis LEGE 11480 TaxID=2777977 RepID=A0A928VQ03_9CYAN|nr:response regulator [Romeriopsis navalis]MBE9029979.1 response regulator [Romeriopsis navalis LEGE 11480]
MNPEMTKLTHDLMALSQQRATGELVVRYKNEAVPAWKLYFYMGRLVYATGGSHSVRRWYRAMKQHCPELLNSGWLNDSAATEQPWEVDLLNQMVAQNLITTAQAKLITQSIVQEVMFALIEERFLTSQWKPNVKIAQHSAFLSVEQVITDAQKMRDGWRGSGLGYLQDWMVQFSPDLAPILKSPPNLASQVSQATFQSMIRLLQGKLTLWDVSLHMRRPLADVMRVLMPFIRQGVIELQNIPDVPAPCAVPMASDPLLSSQPKSLIACIDDSPAIGQIMESILTPQGYEVLSILNPLQGISILLERKPDLIFLDLVMPNTNGYELCTFLRKTTSFQETPIIILTGNDGVIDRVRAKLTGASEFLGKPPEPQKVLQTVQKHLGGEVSETATDSGYAVI